MKTALDCIPCFARQALEAARFVTDDPAVHEQAVRSVLRTVAEMDLTQCPPVIAQRFHRELREITGVADPYRAAKDRFNRMALEMLPGLQRQVSTAADPLAVALRLAIAGNVIDLGLNGGLTEQEARRAVANTLHEPFSGDTDEFAGAVREADNILYLADNAGEIVFDRLLIERIGPAPITVAVRGRPILNDATLTDAKAAGLADIVEVIDNGSDAPGTLLGDCSEAFRARFAAADLIIAKGQGNFETLSGNPANIYFLFKAKCPVVAENAAVDIGTHVATRLPTMVVEGETHART